VRYDWAKVAVNGHGQVVPELVDHRLVQPERVPAGRDGIRRRVRAELCLDRIQRRNMLQHKHHRGECDEDRHHRGDPVQDELPHDWP
jgi:hypothetical protein